MFPFEVDPTSDLPLWVQLRNRIAYLINDGTLAPGDKLPTMRQLAVDLGINYNTVSKVYQSLEEDGYIQSKRRQGAFVCDVSDKPGVSIAVTAEIVTAEYLQRCQELGMSLEDIDARFTASLVEAKAKRDRDQGAADEAKDQASRGRVVRFPRAADDSDQRAAGDGA